jgi:hypothetical protein
MVQDAALLPAPIAAPEDETKAWLCAVTSPTLATFSDLVKICQTAGRWRQALALRFPELSANPSPAVYMSGHPHDIDDLPRAVP